MNYGKEVKKAKAARSDHRKAKLPLVTSRRPDRNPADFITVEREHDQLGLFGASLGTVYFDSDGDGQKDTYGKNRRTGSVGGLLEVPTFGPIDPPASTLTELSSFVKTPYTGPRFVSDDVSAPAQGPSLVSSYLKLPLSGPDGVSTAVNIPLNGPIGLVAGTTTTSSAPSNLTAIVKPPVTGPSFVTDGIAHPSEGPSSLSASIGATSEGPSNLNVSVATPDSGPSSISASINTPAEGPSSLAAGVAAPSEGPSNLAAGVNAPASGPSGLSSEVPTLNIEIVSDQSFADNSSSGTEGEIKYSSDVEYIFIHNGTEWHRTNGGNS